MPTKCKISHLFRNHDFLAVQPQRTAPSHFPQPAHTPQAGHNYSTGSFLLSFSGCCALLFEETPLHQILDELIVSCWKGIVKFLPQDEAGSGCKRRLLKPILCPAAGEQCSSLTGRSEDKQRAACTASPSALPPSSHPH